METPSAELKEVEPRQVFKKTRYYYLYSSSFYQSSFFCFCVPIFNVGNIGVMKANQRQCQAVRSQDY